MRVILTIICLAAFPAFAQYHAGGGKCHDLKPYTPPADLEVKDGFDQHGNPVTSADIAPSDMAKQFQNTDINLDIPVTSYLNQDKYNADLSESRIHLGTLSVNNQDGTTALNGQPIKPQNMYSTDCE